MQRRQLIKILGITMIVQPAALLSCSNSKEISSAFREKYLTLLFSQFKFQEILSGKNKQLLQKLYLAYLPKNLLSAIAYAGQPHFFQAGNYTAAAKIVDECDKLANKKTPYFDLSNPSNYPQITKSIMGIGGVGAGIALTGNPAATFIIGSMGIIANSMFESSLPTEDLSKYLKDDNSINNCVLYKLSELAFNDEAFKSKAIKIDPNFNNPDRYVDESLSQKGLSAEILDELSKKLSASEFRDYVDNSFKVSIEEQNTILNKFVSEYHEKIDQEQKIAQRQIAIVNISSTCEDIESFGNVASNILGSVFGLQKEGQQFQTMAKGVALLINAASMFSVGVMSPMSFANQMTNSMAILGSLISGAPSFEEQVLKVLDNIQKQLKEVQETLERIEKMQFKILKRIEEFIADIKTDFNKVNFKLDDIRLRLLASYELQMQIDRDNTRTNFIENVLLLKSLFNTAKDSGSVSEERLEDVYRKLYTHAKFRSKNVSFTGNTNVAEKIELLADEFRNNGYLDLSIGLLSPLLSTSNIRHTQRGSQLCNPYEWAAGSCGLIEGLYMTKSFDNPNILGYLEELKAEGENINLFIDETVNQPVLQQCIGAIANNFKIRDFKESDQDDLNANLDFADNTFGSVFKSWIEEFHAKYGYTSYTIQEYYVTVAEYSTTPRTFYFSHDRDFYRVEATNDPFDRCLDLELLRLQPIDEELDIGKLYNVVTKDGKDFISEFGQLFQSVAKNPNKAVLTSRALSRDPKNLGKYGADQRGLELVNSRLFLAKCYNLLANYYISCTKTKLNEFLIGKRVSDSNTITAVREFEIQNLVCKIICGYTVWKNTSNEILPLQYQLRNNIYSFNGLIDEKSKTQHLNNIVSLDNIEDFFKLLEQGMANYNWTNSSNLIKNRIILEFHKILIENLEIYKSFLTSIMNSNGLPIVSSTLNKIETAIYFTKLR